MASGTDGKSGSKTKTAIKPGRKPAGQTKSRTHRSREVDRSFLEAVWQGRPAAKYTPGEHIFRQGDPADAVFYIHAGKVEIKVLSDQGKEGVIAILEPKEFLGEGCLAGQPLHMASAIAREDCSIVKTSKDEMIRMLRDDPVFSQKFMKFLLTRNIQIEEDLVDHLFNSSEKRLARCLLLLAHFGKDAKLETVIAPINQETLAARVGTTRSRINFFMNKFRRLGFIEYNGHLKVHSSLLNVIVRD
ncbi:MAG: Crp/Fnr family transcriptional regulator [Dongiaceae bacterium]